MTKEQASKLMTAVEDAGIENFMVVDDITTKLYNGSGAICKNDTANEMFVGIRANNYGGSNRIFNSKLQVVAIDYADVHEFVVGGDREKIISFLKSLGVELTDDDKKTIVDIDGRNYDIIPPTGNYQRFVPLTQEQYDALSPEEKEKYDEEKAAHDEFEKNYIGQGMAARITY